MKQFLQIKKTNNYIKINKLLLFFLSSITSSFLIASNIEPVKDFNSYPLVKEATSISRGGTLNDKSASEDGIGTILIIGIGNDSNDINNKSYNQTLKQNNINLSENINLKDLTIDNSIVNSINNNKFVKGDVVLNNDGDSCDDGNSLTSGETWLNKVCQGGVLEEGASCDDSDSTTVEDIIYNGVCKGIQSNGSLNSSLLSSTGVLSTNNSNTNGTVIYNSQYNTNYARYVFDGTSKPWIENTGTGLGNYIGFIYNTKLLINKFKLSFGSGYAENTSFKTFVFQGYDGISWEDIQYYDLSSITNRGTTKIYTSITTKSYYGYRLYNVISKGSVYMYLDELVFIESKR